VSEIKDGGRIEDLEDLEGWERARRKKKKKMSGLDHPDVDHPDPAVAPWSAAAPKVPALPRDAAGRKAAPVCTGVLDYFPDALVEVARVSKVGNDQHNPGQPLHWAKEKSKDEADALVRHLLERGTRDSDGMRHSAKVAWRALALLQREIDAEAAGTDCACSGIYTCEGHRA